MTLALERRLDDLEQLLDDGSGGGRPHRWYLLGDPKPTEAELARLGAEAERRGQRFICWLGAVETSLAALDDPERLPL